MSAPLGDDGGYAAVSCLSELETPGTAATALGVCSIITSAFIGLPQAYKIYQRKSARGVSFLTLGLGNVGAFLYVLNLTILHYNQIALASSRDFAFWVKAQRSLTFVWVELLNALSMLVIYPVALYYAEDEPWRLRLDSVRLDVTLGTRQAAFLGFVAQAVVVAVAWLPAVFTFAVDGRCEPLADYGNALGLVVAVIIVCKFLPQLYASLKAEGSHSLSYVTYGVDAVAGVVAWAQKVFVTHERLSSWLPPLFLHALEVTVLCINYYNDTKSGGFGGGSFARLFEDEFGDSSARDDGREGRERGWEGGGGDEARDYDHDAQRTARTDYGAGGSGDEHMAFEGMEQAQRRRGLGTTGRDTSFL
jgi:uncharacterized protein with PQ loop repeat